MINRVVLVGRLTKDVEIRYTNNGKVVANFTLAVNRQFTNQNGERESDFINCVFWGKGGETFAQYTAKGSQVAVEGRLATSSYENDQRQRIYKTEVNVDGFSFLDSKQQNEQRRNNPQKFPQANNGQSGNFGNNQYQNASEANFGANNAYHNNNQQNNFGGGQVIDEDDIPF